MTPEEALIILQEFIDQNPAIEGYFDAASFKVRYPEFAAVPDATVTIFLAEALLEVDGTWPADFIGRAHGLSTAHGLKLEGYGSSSIAPVAGLPNIQNVTRFKALDLEVSFSEKAIERANEDSTTSTIYGRQFIELRNKIFGGGVWAV